MPDPSPPTPPDQGPEATGAHGGGDAAVNLMAGGERGDAPENGDIPDLLDAALAETAAELAEPEGPSISDDEFLDFSDPQSVLGEMVNAPELDLDDEQAVAVFAAERAAAKAQPAHPPQPEPSEPPKQQAPSEEGLVVEAGAAAVDPATAVGADDSSDFADAATVLGEVSRELDASAPPEEKTEADAAEGDAGGPDAPREVEKETAAPVVERAAAEGAESAGAIDQLDEVLADKAEAVMKEAGPTPRVAQAVEAPVEEAAAPTVEAVAVAAPVEVAVAPVTPASKPASAPAAVAAPAPEKAEPAPEAEATKPRKPRVRVGVVAAAALGRVLTPLSRLDARMSPTARQTVAWAAAVTLFNASGVWAFVLLRGPAKAPEVSGEGRPFYASNEQAASGESATHAGAKKEEAPKAAHEPKKEAAHGGAEKKASGGAHGEAKKTDAHGAKKEGKEAASKKGDKKQASAHH